VSFHPLHPLLLSVSGSRHFALPSSRSGPLTASSPSDSTSDSTSESEDSDDSGDSPVDEEILQEQTSVNITKGLRVPQPYTLDSSVKMWGFYIGGEKIN